MTAAEFYDIATTSGGLTSAEALAELDEQQDNEDKVLLAELGTLTFAALNDRRA